MTRLINADKFKDSMKYVCDSGGWLEPVTTAVKEYVVKNIDAQPTVDAIPIEWIFDWENRYMNALPPEFQGETVIELFMEDWRKEQEKQNEAD